MAAQLMRNTEVAGFAAAAGAPQDAATPVHRAFAALPGANFLFDADNGYSLTDGWINLADRRRGLRAETAGARPPLSSGIGAEAVNGIAGRKFLMPRRAAACNLAATDRSFIKVGNSTGYFVFVGAVAEALSGNIIVSTLPASPQIAPESLPLTLMWQPAAPYYFKLYKGSLLVRMTPTVIADLGLGVMHIVIFAWDPTGMRLWVDGALHGTSNDGGGIGDGTDLQLFRRSGAPAQTAGGNYALTGGGEGNLVAASADPARSAFFAAAKPWYGIA